MLLHDPGELAAGLEFEFGCPVTELLSTNVDTSPLNEGQARALAPLRERPEEMTEAWMEASADGEPTATKIKEAVSRRLDIHFSSESDEWATPQDLFDQLDKEFKFELDVCALDSSAKCPTYFDRVASLARVRLKAKRRWGELLGPADDKGGRPPSETVTDGNGSDRVQQRRARKLAAVPEEMFIAYSGELLGPAEKPGGDTREAPDRLSDADYQAVSRARKLADVPVATETTRERRQGHGRQHERSGRDGQPDP